MNKTTPSRLLTAAILMAAIFTLAGLFAPTQTASAQEARVAGMTKRWSNISRNPDATSGVVGALPPNTEVLIVDRLAPNWIRIESEFGHGWIPISAFSNEQVAGPDGEDQLAGTPIVVNRWTNIFSAAANDATAVGALPPGGEATVVQRQGFWLPVTSELGDGWIPIIEAIMVSTRGTQGISLTSLGRVISETVTGP